MSVLGSVAIEVSLDMSGVDKQLKSLESKKLKPIKQGLSLDVAGLQQELKQLHTKIDPIKVDLSPNIEDFQKKLQRVGKLSGVKVDLTADIDGLSKKVQGLRIDPIKVDLSPNVGDFQEKLRRLGRLVGEVEVKLVPDVESFRRKFQDVSNLINSTTISPRIDNSELQAFGKHLNSEASHLKSVIQEFNQNLITPRVDHSELDFLNQHLDIKVSHLKSVIQEFNQNLITPRVNNNELTELTQDVGKTANTFNDTRLRLNVDSEAIYHLSQSLDYVAKNIYDINQQRLSFSVSQSSLSKQISDIKKELQGQRFKMDLDTGYIAQQIQESLQNLKIQTNLSSKDTDKPKPDTDAKELKKIESAVRGQKKGLVSHLITGATESLGAELFKNAQLGIKDASGFDINKSVRNATRGGATVVKEIVFDNEQFQAAVKNVQAILDQRLRKAGYRFGDAIVASLENNEGDIVSKLNSFTKSLIDGVDFSKLGQELLTELKDAADELKGGLLSEDVMRRFTAPLSEAMSEFREVALQERAIPLVRERALEISRATKGKSDTHAPKAVKEDTDTLYIAVGGYAGARGLSGKTLVSGQMRSSPGLKEDVKKANPNAEVIWAKNADSDIPREALGDAPKKLVALLTSLGKPNLRGYSKDAVEIAAQALAAKEKNPEINIKILGESGGGFAAEEAHKILQMLGVKSEYLAVGTPDFIGGLDKSGKKILSPDESLGAETSARYARVGLANRGKNQNVLGVKGHPYENYRNAEIAELMNFLHGSPGQASPELIQGFKGTVQQFKSKDKKNLDSRQVEKLYDNAFRNLQTIRRYLVEATGETKTELEAIVQEFEQVVVDLAPEDRNLAEAKQAIYKAEEYLKYLREQPGVEAALVATQVAKELEQVVKSLGKDAKNYTGTTKQQYTSAAERAKLARQNLLDPTIGIKQGVNPNQPKSKYQITNASNNPLVADFKSVVEHFGAIDKGGLGSEQISGVVQAAFENLKVAKEHLQSATQETKTDFEEILKAFADIIVDFTPENAGLVKQAILEKSSPQKEDNPLVSSLNARAEKIGLGFSEYAQKGFTGKIEALQETGDIPGITQQIEEFSTMAARAKKELEEIRKLLIQQGVIEKNNSANEASRAKARITQSVKIAQKAVRNTDAAKRAANPDDVISTTKGIDLVRDTESKLKDLEKHGIQVGQDLMQGFEEGANQGGIKANQAIEISFERILETVDAVLDRHSPSEEMRKRGLDTGKGYEIGAVESLSKAGQKIKGIIQNLLGDIKTAIKGLDADALPSIHPEDKSLEALRQQAKLEAQKQAELNRKKRTEASAQRKADLDAGKQQPPVELQSQIETSRQQAKLEAQKQAELNRKKRTEASAQRKAELEANKRPQTLTGVNFDNRTPISSSADRYKSDTEGLQQLNAEFKVSEELLDRATSSTQIPDWLTSIQGGFKSALTAAKGFASFAIASFAQNFFRNVAQDAFKAYVELDKMKTVLNFASGSSIAGSQNLAFVKKQVADLKIPLNASIDGFTKLQAASRGTPLAGQGTKELFRGVSQASTVLSLNADETQGSILALSQMISKGKVAAEELRGQLGERIPGALGIASRAMGMTEAQFSNMLDTGRIMSQDFLPKFAKQLQAEFGDAALDASGNAQSAIFDLQNSILGFQQGVGEGLAPVTVGGINAIGAGMKGLSAISKELGIALLAVTVTLSVKMGVALKEVIANLIATKLATGTLGGGISSLANTINNSSSAKMAVGLFAVLEVVNLLNSAINTELIQSFDKAAKSAKRAAEEANKPFEEAKKKGFFGQAWEWITGKNESGKKNELRPETSSGVGRAFDPVIGAINAITFSEGLKLKTWGEYEQTNINKNTAGLIGDAGNLMGGGRRSLSEMRRGDLPQLEKDLQKAEQQRQIIQADIKRNFTDKGLIVSPGARQDLLNVSQLITDLNSKREGLSEPITLNISRADRGIASLKAQVEALQTEEAIAAVGGDEAAQKLTDQLNKSIKALQNFKAESEQALGALKLDPILRFEQSLRKLNLALAEGQEANQLRFNNSRSAIGQQQLAGFSSNRFAGKDAAIESAKNDLAKNRADVEALQAAVSSADRIVGEAGFQSTLQKLGVSSDSSVAKISDVLQYTQDEADKAILEKLRGITETRARFSESQASLSEMPIRLKQAEQDKALFTLDERSSDSKAGITRGQNETLTFYRRGQAKRSISGEEAGIANARIELENTQALKDELDTRLSSLRNYHNQGIVSAEEFERRRRDLLTEYTGLEKQEAENQLALADAVKAKKIADLEFFNRQAEGALTMNRSNATTAAKEKLLMMGLTQSAQDEFNQAEIAADRQVTEGKKANLRKQLYEYQNMYGAGDISLREFKDKQVQINQELAGLNTQLIDQKIKEEENYRAIVERNIQRQMQLEDAQFKDLNSQLSVLKNAQELYTASLDRTLKLEESRFNLGKALGDSSLSSTESLRDKSSRSLDLAKRLKDENLDPKVRSEIVGQLQSNGFGGLNLQSKDPTELLKVEIAILDERSRIESDIAAKKLESLQREQEYQRKSLEIDLQRQKIAAESAIYDAQGLQLAAQKSKLESEGALRVAKVKKDDVAIQAAQIGLEIAQREAEIADKKLDSSLENLRIQEELTKNAKIAQEATQRSAIDQQLSAEAARKQATSLERVETIAGKAAEVKDDNSKPTASEPSGWKNPLQRWTEKEHQEWKRSRQKSSLSGERMESDFQMQSRIMDMKGLGQIVELPRRTVSSIDTSGFDWGQGAGKVPAGYTQSTNGSIYQDYVRREAQSPTVPMPNNNQAPAISIMDGLKTSVHKIEGKLADLAASISNVASRPSTLQVSSPQPVQDAAKIYSDISKNAVKSAGL